MSTYHEWKGEISVGSFPRRKCAYTTKSVGYSQQGKEWGELKFSMLTVEKSDAGECQGKHKILCYARRYLPMKVIWVPSATLKSYGGRQRSWNVELLEVAAVETSHPHWEQTWSAFKVRLTLCETWKCQEGKYKVASDKLLQEKKTPNQQNKNWEGLNLMFVLHTGSLAAIIILQAVETLLLHNVFPASLTGDNDSTVVLGLLAV